MLNWNRLLASKEASGHNKGLTTHGRELPASPESEATAVNKLKTTRQSSGLTQMEMAKAAGLPDRRRRDHENGQWPKSVDVAIRMAWALDMSVEELFGTQRNDTTVTVKNINEARERGSCIAV